MWIFFNSICLTKSEKNFFRPESANVIKKKIKKIGENLRMYKKNWKTGFYRKNTIYAMSCYVMQCWCYYFYTNLLHTFVSVEDQLFVMHI